MSQSMVQRRRRALLAAAAVLFGWGVAAAAIRGGDDGPVEVSAHRSPDRAARAEVFEAAAAATTTTATATATTSTTEAAPSTTTTTGEKAAATSAPAPVAPVAPAPSPAPTPERTAAETRSASAPAPTRTAEPAPARRAFSLSPNSGPVHTRVIASGGGCAGPRYGVGVTLHDPSGREVAAGSGPAAGDGTWSAPFFVPASADPGTYEVRASCIAVNDGGGENVIVFQYLPQPFDVTG